MKKTSLITIAVLICSFVFANENETVNEIPKYKNAVKMSHTITVSLDKKQCFDFLINDFSEVYSKISVGHKYFTIRDGGSLKLGSVIDCAETADNQSIVHEYIVDELVNNKRVSYYSKPTYSKVQLKKKIIEGQSNTYVYWDFKELSNGETEISITIIVQLNSGFEKMFINMVGGFKPWKKHCVEEMEGLKKVLIDRLS